MVGSIRRRLGALASGILAAGILALASAGTATAQTPLYGQWYDDDGHSYLIAPSGGQLMVGFLVSQLGAQQWYSFTCPIGANPCTGPILQYGLFTDPHGDTNYVQTNYFGTISLSFNSPSSGTATTSGTAAFVGTTRSIRPTPTATQPATSDAPGSRWYAPLSNGPYGQPLYFINAPTTRAGTNATVFALVVNTSGAAAGTSTWSYSYGAMVSSLLFQGSAYVYSGGATFPPPTLAMPTTQGPLNGVTMQINPGGSAVLNGLPPGAGSITIGVLP